MPVYPFESTIKDGNRTVQIGDQLRLPQKNDATNPSLAFGDGDSGVYEESDDKLCFSTAGTKRIYIDNVGNVKNQNDSRWVFLNETATDTNPNIVLAGDDLDTGIGKAAADQLSLIAGGVEALRLTETTGDIAASGGVIDAVNGIAGLDASGDLAESVIPGILNKYVIGDNLILSHDAEATNDTTASYLKVKTITLDTLYKTPITIRIKFDLKSDAVATSGYGKIYKNGAPVGTAQTRGATTYETFSEDLSFASGDTLELWGHTFAGTVYVQNFRVYGVVTQVPIAEAIVDGNVGVAAPLEGTNT